MGLIVDSSILIAAEKRRFDLARFAASLPHEKFFLAAITASELLHGVARARPIERKTERSTFVETLLARIPTVEFDLPAARFHAQVWAELEGQGLRIGPHDLLIAATALRHDYHLATLNRGEFTRVSGLRLVDPTPFLIR